jgi:hypothetical protein
LWQRRVSARPEIHRRDSLLPYFAIGLTATLRVGQFADWEHGSSLLEAQGDERIDERGAARRDIASQERDSHQE